ncbi:MAG: ABC transporter permease [Bacteroidales bacterium]|uniref:FtsX-like permease family protein n=1 Tax=Porphyromonas sp. TaxID=1924944 RepID=UPI0029753E96|nr:FtsX-like permease family protein [Porphyromonas sp.]MDD7437909.1 ABC transporter permease [Bacteroidales bacterium]MDY3067146.1 FtsX-like permease family protein [Porphyromonas sp.]
MNKHVLKIIWNERKSNIALIIELFLISTFLWFVIDRAYPALHTYLKPLGYSIDNIYIITLDDMSELHPDYNPDITMDDRVEAIQTIVDRIRNHPEVNRVAVSIHGRPETKSKYFNQIYLDTLPLKAAWRVMSPEAVEMYQFEEVNGSNSRLTQALRDGQIIVNEGIAKIIEETGVSAIGTELWDNPIQEESATAIGAIGAIAKDSRYTRFSNVEPFYITPLTHTDLAEVFWIGMVEISVVPKSGVGRGFAERFREEMTPRLRIGNMEMSDVFAVGDANTFESRTFEKTVKINGYLLLFLLLNILLGISGVFWYRTQKRRGEIGLRIALGDTPKGVLRLYYREGIIIFTLAFLLTIAMIAIFFRMEILDTDIEPLNTLRFVAVMVTSYLVVTGVIVLSIWLPARRILKISPAETLKEE